MPLLLILLLLLILFLILFLLRLLLKDQNPLPDHGRKTRPRSCFRIPFDPKSGRRSKNIGRKNALR